MPQTQRRPVDRLSSFSGLAEKLALVVDQRSGSVFIIGDKEPTVSAALEISAACKALPKDISISATYPIDLEANLVLMRDINEVPREVMRDADAIVLFGSQPLSDAAQTERFRRAVAAVDVTADISFFMSMSDEPNQGVVWIAGEGITRFQLDW